MIFLFKRKKSFILHHVSIKIEILYLEVEYLQGDQWECVESK